MYSDWKPMAAGDDLDMVQNADTSLYKIVVPTGHRSFIVRAITQRVHTASAADTACNVKLLNGATVVATASEIPGAAAVGTATYDVVPDGTGGQRFKAGDTLELQVATAATTTGKLQVILWID